MDKAILEKYEPVIGLEVHAQLLTQSKIFNNDAAQFGDAPNTNVSVITLAHPGTLPRLNKQAVELAIRMGLACNSEIARYQIFDRKNYFYPDLPKGYQITQDRTPICRGGHIAIRTKSGARREVPLNRIHLEEDAGKSMHLVGKADTAVDFNRAGVALIEIVTEPALHAAEEAGALLAEIRKLVRYLEICDGNMEEGSLRCDANVSVRLKGAKQLGKKVEIKNMNSIRFVQRAIDYEIERQVRLLERGEQVISETRLFDASKEMTFGMRTKEELNDYRYFPDPDLSPLVVSAQWLSAITNWMPVLPNHRIEKYVAQWGLSEYDAEQIAESRPVADFFEATCKHTTNAKAVANWLMGPIKSYLNEHHLEIQQLQLQPEQLAELIRLIDRGDVNFSVASQHLLPLMLRGTDRSAQELARELNLIQDRSEDTIVPLVDQVLKEFPLKVEEYHNGKKGILAMFMGEVMKRSRGKADPKMANDLLLKKLSKK